MVQLESQDAHKQRHLDQHRVEMPVAVALQLFVVRVLSQQRHLALCLNLLGGRLDAPKQVAHISDFLIASQLNLLSEVTVCLRLIDSLGGRVVRNNPLAIVSELVLDLLTLVLVSMDRQGCCLLK